MKKHVLILLAPVAAWVWALWPDDGCACIKGGTSGVYSMTGAAKTAVDVACLEDALRPGLTHAELGLARPASYSSKHVQSVTVDVKDASRSEITVVWRRLAFETGEVLDAGETLVYGAECRPGQNLDWTVAGGSLPERLGPDWRERKFRQ